VDYPHVAALLPDQTVLVHNLETQTVAQTLPAPPLPAAEAATDPIALLAGERRAISFSAPGFLVPSQRQSAKLRLRRVPLLGRNAHPSGRGAEGRTSPIDLHDADGRLLASVRGEADGEADTVPESDEGGATEPASVSAPEVDGVADAA